MKVLCLSINMVVLTIKLLLKKKFLFIPVSWWGVKKKIFCFFLCHWMLCFKKRTSLCWYFKVNCSFENVTMSTF